MGDRLRVLLRDRLGLGETLEADSLAHRVVKLIGLSINILFGDSHVNTIMEVHVDALSLGPGLPIANG